MARVVLVSLYDKGALGARHVSGMLKRAGHEVALVYLKEYNQRLKKQVRGLRDEDLHEGVTPLGEDMVHGITSPVSAVEQDLFLDLLETLDPHVVGLSLRTCTLRTAQHLTGRIKERLRAPVIWGSIAPTIDPDEAVGTAIAHRPDYLQTQIAIENNDISLLVTRNQLLPQLDLFVRAASTGLGRSPRPTCSMNFDTVPSGRSCPCPRGSSGCTSRSARCVSAIASRQ